MQPLNLPTYNLNVKKKDSHFVIFDPFRKKEVKLTPEEWVRQNFLQYMVHDLGYPAGLISVEHQLRLNTLSRRCDIVAFNSKAQPIIIIECKAPNVVINQTTFDQIATYNIKLNVDYLIVTNGLTHFCCKISYNPVEYQYLRNAPHYSEILSTG